MPLYMDIHTVDSDSFSVEDVVKAHMEDLAIQAKFGVVQLKYWVNVDAKTLFCLMEGPNKEACHQVHKESHGNTACNIIEVADDEFNLFLGVGNHVNDLAQTVEGEIDTGYRTIILVEAMDFSGAYTRYVDDIYQSIKNHEGTVILSPENEIMVSFIYASQAIVCTQEIEKILQSISTPLEYTIAIASGRPVDEKGDNLFEETKRKVRHMCILGSLNQVYLDTNALELSKKETGPNKFSNPDFQIFGEVDSEFLFDLYNLLNTNLNNEDFKSDDLHLALGLSKSQAYRKIKSLTRLAPNQLIQEFRLRNALAIIKQKSHTIAETAYESGFNSPTYFTRVFKKRFGLLPTDFAQL